MSLRAAAGSFVGALCAVLLGWAPVSGQDAEAEISISGTSTVRNWTCEVTAPVRVSRGGSGAQAPGFPDGVASATVTVRVADIECPEEQMIEHLQEAMQVEEYPEIVYRLEEYSLSDGGEATLSGTMTILDTTNPIEIGATLEEADQGVQVAGETTLDMTEYGVEPPTVMLGMLEVGPVITLDFTTVVPRPSQ